jgi:hypothetical protein
LEITITMSAGCTKPNPPCKASPGAKKAAGRSRQHNECAILRAAAAEVPHPVVKIRAWQCAPLNSSWREFSQPSRPWRMKTAFAETHGIWTCALNPEV